MLRAAFIPMVATLLTAASCPFDNPQRVPNGNWGGEHIGMIVADTGATIEYDCATGVISEPLLLRPQGEFSWKGIHYPGHGGPVRVDEPSNAHEARYTGKADASQMIITLTILDSVQTSQTFTLARGANPRVFKCL